MVGVAGTLSGIAKGMDEMMSTNAPIWGLIPKRLSNILVAKYGFISPPAWFIKIMIKQIPNRSRTLFLKIFTKIFGNYKKSFYLYIITNSKCFGFSG
jgi:hypothetical protein